METAKKHPHLSPILHKIIREFTAFAKKNVVMFVALFAALITCLIVPIDGAYLEYFDYKTLTCLFCTLACVCALKNVDFFYMLAQKIVCLFKTARLCVLALTCVTFLGSMLLANDMALLTFLPLGFFVLDSTEKRKYMAVTFILQNIAANLGGMLTPFGNPQNLYLYTFFSIPTTEFTLIMLPPFLLSVALIVLCCFLFVKNEPMELKNDPIQVPVKRTAAYLVLFALSIVIVFRVIPFWIGLIVIPLALFLLDRAALKAVDYPLLLTFVFFFVFAGNMARIEPVRNFFSTLLEKNTLIVSILSCQCISNVPSAILLSQFTIDYPALLLGVNIGGVGTLISSLASLITFREYLHHNPHGAGKYLLVFSAFNFAFLIILTAFALFLI